MKFDPPNGGALGIPLALPVLVRAATRHPPASWRGFAALFGEIFATVMVAMFVVRIAAAPAPQKLSVRVP